MAETPPTTIPGCVTTPSGRVTVCTTYRYPERSWGDFVKIQAIPLALFFIVAAIYVAVKIAAVPRERRERASHEAFRRNHEETMERLERDRVAAYERMADERGDFDLQEALRSTISDIRGGARIRGVPGSFWSSESRVVTTEPARSIEITCPECRGTPLADMACTSCLGTGKVWVFARSAPPADPGQTS